MFQKIVNGIALASGIVSLTVVGAAGYLYVNKDAIVDNVKGQVMEAVTGSLGGALGGGALGGLTTPGMDATAPSTLPDVPTSPF
jgi:hypothetical protein|tara:strand:+ start:366 stop:617 length:252 start_codon:yes stop_codon:yes gene_type:complete